MIPIARFRHLFFIKKEIISLYPPVHTCYVSKEFPTYFIRFSSLNCLGVNDYINRLRIEKAISLLTNTNLNINEISSEVGFTYPRYFSSTFKQMKGMTPKQFREENRMK